MHTDRTAEAHIVNYLLSCGEDPAMYHTYWAAEELHRRFDTWDMDAIRWDTFESVVFEAFDSESLLPNYY